MRILILTTDYTAFLAQLYRNSSLKTASFDDQLRTRESELFNVSAFYASHFRALGCESRALYANNVWMQAAWAREHGMDVPQVPERDNDQTARFGWLKRKLRPYKTLIAPLARRAGLIPTMSAFERDVLLAQVEDYAPDVILNQDMETVDSDVIRRMRRPGRTIIGQIGVDPPQGLDTGAYDFGLSQIPWVVDFFRSKGLPAARVHLAFEPRILEQMGPQPARDIPLSFVGALTAAHAKRVAFLEEIARTQPLELWVPNLAGIPASSPLHACRKGQAFGAEMFNILRRSRITLNSHINVARGSATNMRLFEATGCGTFLLTDNLPDLKDLFTPGVEVGTYDDTRDCVAKIGYYLAHEDERAGVAAAGQRKTLSQHNYANRARELLDIIATIRS